MKKILVLESDFSTLNSIRYILKDYELVESYDIFDAIENLTRIKDIFLIIGNYSLSETGEINLLKEFRSFDRNKNIPLILTIEQGYQLSEKCLESFSAQAIIEKPISINRIELEKIVENFLILGKGLRNLSHFEHIKRVYKKIL